jgi:hypothetical protein
MNIENKVCELKAQIKLDLIEYYDGIKSEIDISSQEKLLDLEKDIYNDKKCEKREKVNKYNSQFIETVENNFNLNCKEIDDYFKNEMEYFIEDKEEIKRKALKNYVAFINLNEFYDKVIDENIVGMLIKVDWYLDENQINFLCVFFKILLLIFSFNQ